jgi:hypothetical protein
MAQQIDVQFELCAGRREGEHLVVELFEGSARAEQSEACCHAGDVRVDRYLAQAVAEKEDAGGRLSSDAGERAERVTALGRRSCLDPVEAERISDRAEDLLDTLRLHLRDASRADRQLDIGKRRVTDLLPAREALA